MDVAYTETDSPVGRLLVAVTDRGLVRVSFQRERRDDVLEELAERLSPRVLEAPRRLDEVRRELDQYFQGERTEFELPLDWSLTSTPFRRKVLERHGRRSPTAATISYRDAAEAAGNERAVRAAGDGARRRTRSRSWCPATACFAPAAPWAATAAASTRSGSCSTSSRAGQPSQAGNAKVTADRTVPGTLLSRERSSAGHDRPTKRSPVTGR